MPQRAEKTPPQTTAAENKQKIGKAQSLWKQGRPLKGTLAERYLREHRKIEGDLSDNLRYLPFFTDTASKQSFPCLMTGARSPSGEITAVQLTFLHPTTAAKANIEVPKKSFGVIKGSAVTLQACPHPREGGKQGEPEKNSNILFIAEGVETALSLKSAGIQGTIKASLGLSNIKRIVPEKTDTPIVICADHDAPHSPAAKSLEKSVMSLQESGYSVTVIKPYQLGNDFNDVLKKQGPQGVREAIKRNLGKENFLGKEQLDKVFPKDLPAGSTPARDSLQASSLIEKAASHDEQALQRYENGLRPVGQKSNVGLAAKESTQFSSASLREQKSHLKEIKEIELDMERER